MKDLNRVSAEIRKLKRRPDLTEDENGQLNVTLKLIELPVPDDLLFENMIELTWKLEDALERVRNIWLRFQNSNIVMMPAYEDAPEAVEVEQEQQQAVG